MMLKKLINSLNRKEKNTNHLLKITKNTIEIEKLKNSIKKNLDFIKNHIGIDYFYTI
jgi:hypothetical protein